MTDVFLKLINMSISASWIVIALLILRFAIKKAPRYISCILWGIVGVRLICPFTLKSILSVIPTSATVDTVATEEAVSTAVTQEAINIAPPIINQAVNPIIAPDTNITVAPETNIMDTVILIASIIWAVGAVLMLLYFVFNYIKIKRTAMKGEPYGENIKRCDYISSPFVIGIIKPVICLPLNIEKEYIEYVVAHENAHIKRKDNIWKPLAFLILSVYWFNPLIWVSFILLSKDIEFACDEKVIREHGTNYKKPYSMALMNCSSIEDKRLVNLSLGEISVKERILKIVDYKKPPLWITVTAIVLCCALMVGFLTDPVDRDKTDKKPDTVETVVSEKEDTTDTSSDLTESVVSTPEESKPAESKPQDTSSKEETVSSTPSKQQNTSSVQKPITSSPVTSKPQYATVEIGKIKDNTASLSKDTVQKIKMAYLDSLGFVDYNQETIDKMPFEYYTTLSDGSMLLFIDREDKVTDTLSYEFIDEYTYAYYGKKYLRIYKYGKFYSLQIAYRSGLISKAIVEEVAQKYPQIDVSYKYPERDVTGEKDEYGLPKLTNKEEQEILAERGLISEKLTHEFSIAYANYWSKKVATVGILDYYGVYNGAAVVKTLSGGNGYQWVTGDTVGGIYFPWTGEGIIVFKNNKIYSLQEAYDNEFLTFEDLCTIRNIDRVDYNY